MNGLLCLRRSLITGLFASACGLELGSSSSKAQGGLHRGISHAACPAPPMAGVAKPPGAARLLLTGDVMLGRGVDQVLPFHCQPRIYEPCVQDAKVYTELALERNGPLPVPPPVPFDYPWGTALEDVRARQPDVFLINLETAVTTHSRPWPDKGINYRMHPGNVEALTMAGVQVASLANNHVLDWSEGGLLETLDVLQQAGIATVGAGRDAAEAQRPAIIQVPATQEPEAAAGEAAGAGAGVAAEPSAAAEAPAAGSSGRVLVWAVGHESSGVPAEWAAGRGRPGVFVTDLSAGDVERLAQLVRAKKRPGRDVAVVSVHWGSNWGFEVPKQQQRFAHALIDRAGVDVVHGHSSHHAKGAEVYGGKLILYGAGDLISDYEGISNAGIEAAYPPDYYRDDVGLLWYADVSLADGSLRQLALTPTRLRHLRLEPPDPGDWRYIESTMAREARKLGALGVHREGAALLFNLPPAPPAASNLEE